MSIHYQTYARFSEFFGKEGDIELSKDQSLLDLLNVLTGEDEKKRSLIFDESGKIRRYVIILKNKERILNEKTSEITLQDGDEIVLYPPVSGG
jgi:sulfur-carrier protein